MRTRKNVPIDEAERAAWPAALRAAALRFWLSRLNDQLFPRAGDLTQIKDPDRMREVLEANHEADGSAALALS